MLLFHDFYWWFSVLVVDVKESCLDEAAEFALLPSFDGFIGDIKISGNLMLALLQSANNDCLKMLNEFTVSLVSS